MNNGCLRWRGWVAVVVLALSGQALSGPAVAGCQGTDLLAADPALAAAVDARAGDLVYGTGRLWEARRGGAEVIVFGTYHIPDPRVAVPPALGTHIRQADRVLVEALEEEQRRMVAAMSTNPRLVIAFEGPGNAAAFSPAEWAILTKTFAAKGIPAEAAARLQPWFLNLALAVPPCAAAALDGGGVPLDAQIERLAGDKAVGLERYEALFDALQSVPPEMYLELVRISLPMIAAQEDAIETMVALYLAGEIEAIQDFSLVLQETVTPQETVETLSASFFSAVLERRNRDWMADILAAASSGKTVVAVGALHLPGEVGVLRLLETEGFEIRRLD